MTSLNFLRFSAEIVDYFAERFGDELNFIFEVFTRRNISGIQVLELSSQSGKKLNLKNVRIKLKHLYLIHAGPNSLFKRIGSALFVRLS